MSYIEAAKQIECAVDGDMVQVFALPAQTPLDVIRRERSLCSCESFKDLSAWFGYLVAQGLQNTD